MTWSHVVGRGFRQRGPLYKLASGSKHLTVLLHSKVWTRLEKNIGLVAANPYASQLWVSGNDKTVVEYQNKKQSITVHKDSMQCI